MVNTMDYTKASKQQLIAIMKYDHDCPTDLLKGVIEELIKRNALKAWLSQISRKFFGDMNKGVKFWIEESDVIQMGYIGVFKALDKFIQGKSSFATFSRYYIYSEWQQHLEMFNRQKRTMDRESISYDMPVTEREGDLRDLIPSQLNVEKSVIMKLHFEEQLSSLTPLQRESVFGYMQGYGMKEIAVKIGKNRRSVERAFHRAIEKMGGEPISLIENRGVRGETHEYRTVI